MPIQVLACGLPNGIADSNYWSVDYRIQFLLVKLHWSIINFFFSQVTAGGEGSTRIWNVNHLHETSCRQLKFPADFDQVPRLVAVTQAGYLVASQLGALYGWKSASQDWVKLFQDDRLGNGSVLDTDGQTIIFGTRTGAVFLFVSGPSSSLELLATHQLEGSKIYSVHLVASRRFIACLDNGRMLLMDRLTGNESLPRFILPEGKQRWPTCVLATQNHFMIGDREGSFHLYSAENEVVFLVSEQTVNNANNILFRPDSPSVVPQHPRQKRLD